MCPFLPNHRIISNEVVHLGIKRLLLTSRFLAWLPPKRIQKVGRGNEVITLISDCKILLQPHGYRFVESLTTKTMEFESEENVNTQLIV